MSAPDTNVDRQARRHRTPLVGMALVVGFAAVAMLIWLSWEAADGNTPGEDTVVTDTEQVAPGVVVEETEPAVDGIPAATGN